MTVIGSQFLKIPLVRRLIDTYKLFMIKPCDIVTKLELEFSFRNILESDMTVSAYQVTVLDDIINGQEQVYCYVFWTDLTGKKNSVVINHQVALNGNPRVLQIP